MNLTNEFQPIRDWAAEKGIYFAGNIKTQTLKLQEEVGELAKAVIENDDAKIWDAIGDCVVVLTSVAHMSGLSIENCINAAYEEIKNRKGSMSNGTFIKQSEEDEHRGPTY
jgi:NTP pyrophosphatase (non-canonical NTP hydrolase)